MSGRLNKLTYRCRFHCWVHTTIIFLSKARFNLGAHIASHALDTKAEKLRAVIVGFLGQHGFAVVFVK